MPPERYNSTGAQRFHPGVTEGEPMRFELREHTADVEIVGRGSSLGEAFAGVADGMAAAMCDDWPHDGERQAFAIQSESPEALLFDYLDELIYRRDVDDVLPVENDAAIDRRNGEWRLSGTYRGVPVSMIRGREIKAPTYADMEIAEDGGEWTARAVLDV